MASSVDPGRFTARRALLSDLVRYAWGFNSLTSQSQIIGGPAWMTTTRFDIVATTKGLPSLTMLKALLQDRFKIVAHVESRDTAVYALILGRAERRLGPGIRLSTSQCVGPGGTYSPALTGEAREAGRGGTESFGAFSGLESPASTDRLMEEVCERDNLKEALRRVKANKGSAGVDGMTIGALTDYLKQRWPTIREQLLSGTYEPKPVRRVDIAKPDGGVRKLGIPSVLDRFIQQAVLQVLQRRWDRTFSQYSYGFRPGRSAHHAVAQAQQYVAQGYGWVVDLDLEKFFDRVNHDKLMGHIAQRVEDKRL